MTDSTLNAASVEVLDIVLRNKEEKSHIIKYFKGKSDLSISISCHSLDDIFINSSGIDYFFLSPVFDSISKTTGFPDQVGE